MKNLRNLFLIGLLSIGFSIQSYGQHLPPPNDAVTETVTINKADLTPEQLAKLDTENKMKEVTSDVHQVSEWAGAGKEVGIAIKEGLGAASDGVANFAATPPGKLTMFLIAWKVMYKDVFDTADKLTGVLIGVPLLFFVDWFFISVYWRTILPLRVLVSSEGNFWNRKKTYTSKNTWFLDLSSEGQTGTQALFFAFVFVTNWALIGAVIFH